MPRDARGNVMEIHQNRQRPQPHAAIDVAVDSPGVRPTYVARCACGWNAIESFLDPAAAQARLHLLVEEHRKICPRTTSESQV